MSIALRKKTWTIVFRPFGQQIMLGLKDVDGKRQAAAIESELMYALQTKSYGGLTALARAACIKLFTNQEWELPEELLPPSKKPPETALTLWRAIELFVESERYKTSKFPFRYETGIVHLVNHFGKKAIMKDIWVPEIREYRIKRQNQGKKPATVNREVSILSVIFANLTDHRLLEANPCRLLRRLSEKSGLRSAYISQDDIERIMGQCPNWYADIVWTAYLTGCRRSEITNLRWRSVNLKKRIINLHATETKESHSKRIPIHRDLLPMFERLGKIRDLTDDYVFKVNGHKVDVQSCKRPWDRSLDKLDFPKPRPRFHDIRHTWLTNARMSKIDHEIRQAILGHSDRMLKVSERYGRISEDELVEAIDLLVTNNGETEILTAVNA
jgi:integrase